MSDIVVVIRENLYTIENNGNANAGKLSRAETKQGCCQSRAGHYGQPTESEKRRRNEETAECKTKVGIYKNSAQ
ncbi:hypothetical protein CHL67_02675 [Prosthecochloris sp. GSB1]|nr:hypothetical protein CHL67_02675 [Prosthecochloris sp. GSB1]